MNATFPMDYNSSMSKNHRIADAFGWEAVTIQ
ncbi:hypothetical protein EV130_105407 [Rhizobium azibense]|uniref:Uncharacterized protein n=1 Tax=Rhizobium azibense TaxID=1136135 RepID=A0A4R3QWQ1_9HYPH|nr:hypothetical protein EV130_105407 [Rhizobium azibense]TCU39968.1 hypothetical protein EV129_102105 [Rhizobium azibense]